MGESRFTKSARACIDNGNRLLDDAEMMEFGEPPSTSYFLAVTAQEEFAKAFLLCFVARHVIPWSPLINRATRDHACKQLLAIIMKHIIPDDAEYFSRVEGSSLKFEEHRRLLDALKVTPDFEGREKIWQKLNAIHESWDRLPRPVADAINLLRREKIGRWESHFSWDEAPNHHDRTAKSVSDGKADSGRQNALYIRLNRNGEVIGSPSGISQECARDARERAKRMCWLVEDLLAGGRGWFDYEKIQSAFKVAFADLTVGTKRTTKRNG